MLMLSQSGKKLILLFEQFKRAIECSKRLCSSSTHLNRQEFSEAEKKPKRNYLERNLRRTYRCPINDESAMKYPRLFTELAKPIAATVVRKLDIKPHERVLEIGFGQGEGLKMVYDRIAAGQGVAYGLELSDLMIEEFENGFISRIAIPGLPPKIQLQKTIEIIVLPYPDSFFDGIFHINVFYFWPQYKMRHICREIMRTLKPGRQLICGIELKELRNLNALRVVDDFEIDPMRYVEGLEAAGFEGVKYVYENVDNSGNPIAADQKKSSDDVICREILMITATKPLKDPYLDRDLDEIWSKLEVDIKNDLVMETVLAEGKDSIPVAQPEHIRFRAFDLKKPSEKWDAIDGIDVNAKTLEGSQPRPDHPINRKDDK